MSVSRLFSIVYLLLDRRQMSAAQLAQRFEVSVRTIYRDVDALSAAGVPIYASPGRNGGIALLDGFLLDRAALSREEQAALLTALRNLPGNEGPAQTALTKLAGLFGRREPDWLQVDLIPWGVPPGAGGRFDTLKAAILQRRQAAFSYLSASGQETQRRVLPVRLVFKGRAWYLQGWCLDRDAYRTFRLSRILALEVSQDRFSRELPPPPPVEDWEGTAGPCVPLSLRFSPRMAFRVYDEFAPGAITREAGGSLLVRTSVPAGGWLCGYLLSFGPEVEVLSPACVREALRALALQTAEKNENLDANCQGFSGTMEPSQIEEAFSMETHFCQSCGMPITDPQLRGTEADGQASPHYCKFCYDHGAFTGEMTMEQMIDFCVPILVREHPGLTEEQARAQMRGFFPTLLRWRKD